MCLLGEAKGGKLRSKSALNPSEPALIDAMRPSDHTGLVRYFVNEISNFIGLKDQS
jgi:hypothetical protein